MQEVFISVLLSGPMISNMHSLVTCRSFLHPISSTGSKISVTCSATHEKSWNTPKSLTASNLFFSGIQQTVSGIPVVIYMQLKKSISKFLSFCNNSTRVIFISHIKISPKGTAVCLPL